ncbi:MAG: amino acid kinase [Gammaproteobacteria bacterium]
MWVVKVGGSLQTSDVLRQVMDDLVSVADQELIIVPGGGLFADQVRAMQQHYQFDDATAHQMALYAMRQYALMLCALAPQLELLQRLEDLPSLQQRRRIPLWSPCQGVTDDADLPASWEVTSDSLALWLAGQLPMAKLLLIKSLPVPSAHIEELARQQHLDGFFPHLAARLQLPVAWLDAHAPVRASQILQQDTIAPQHRLINP